MSVRTENTRNVEELPMKSPDIVPAKTNSVAPETYDQPVVKTGLFSMRNLVSHPLKDTIYALDGKCEEGQV